ncbi:MAG TPA: sigma-70 family RNA polymerase sigma factor [Acidimicrobiales bacterium]|nr:sigma-70 family RNA polymerase sigma factor [Acidimicrobiales bacterium]
MTTKDQEEPSDFDDFFRATLPRAVAVARRVTGTRAEAEDAAIEALAKAHLRWKRIGDQPWREGWVLRVSVNEAIRRLPRSAALPLPADTPDPADEVALRETLTAALSKLPRRQAEVIAMRFLVGLSEPEVAEALALSQGTVKTHLRRGLAALRRSLGRTIEEEHLARIA